MEIESFENNRTKCSGAGAAKSFAFFALGFGLGGFAALLLAPKSGREFRRDIANTAEKGYSGAIEAAGRIKERGAEYIEAGREKGAEMLAEFKEEISDLKEEAVAGADRLGKAVKNAVERVEETIG